MALNVTPKASGARSANQQVTIKAPERASVRLGAPSPSTARSEALKSRLNANQRPSGNQSIPGKSSARQANPIGQQQYTTQPQTKPIGKTSARQETQDWSKVAPPPGGPTQPQEMSQLNISTETARPAAEVTNEPPSPQLVALARQERQLRKAHQQLKAEKDAWKLEQANYVRKDSLLSKPLETLGEVGLSYDQLVELQINQAQPQDPQKPLLDKIAELEARLGKVDEQFTQRDKSAYDAAVGQIRRDATLLVDSDPAFETIKASGETESVVKLIERIFQEEGDVLSVEDASKLVEDKLIENEVARIQKLSKLSKIKSRLAPPTEISEEANSEQQLQPQVKTLSNKGAAQRPLTARERAVNAVLERQRQGKM